MRGSLVGLEVGPSACRLASRARGAHAGGTLAHRRAAALLYVRAADASHTRVGRACFLAHSSLLWDMAGDHEQGQAIAGEAAEVASSLTPPEADLVSRALRGAQELM